MVYLCRYLFRGSAKYKYYNSLELNEYSDYLLAKVVVRNASIVLQTSNLLPNALRLASENKQAFLEAFGDEYIHGGITGGELYVIYKFASKNVTEQTATRTEINTAVKKFNQGGSSNASMSKALTEMKLNSDLDLKIIRIGDDDSLSNNIDTILSYIRRFPQIVNSKSKKARLIEEITEPINNTENFPDAFGEADFVPIIRQKQKLNKIALKLDEVQGALSQDLFINENRNIFKDEDKKKADNQKKELEAFEVDLQNCAEVCGRVLGLCDSCDVFLNKKIEKFFPPFLDDFKPTHRHPLMTVK